MSFLSQFLITELFVFLLIFCRVGGALMVMPGFGEVFISPRVRLIFALMLSAVLTPMLAPHLPAMPKTVAALVSILLMEIFIGVFIGMLVRMMMAAMHSAGTMLATQSGLANAMMFDFTMSGQTTPINNLLTFGALVMIFASDIHHLMLAAIVDSYSLMQAGTFAPVQDFAFTAASYVNKAFLVGVQLASPFIVSSLLVNLGGGVLSRLMPTFQVFFVLMPFQMLLTYFILMVSLPAMMLWYMNYLQDGLSNLLVEF